MINLETFNELREEREGSTFDFTLNGLEKGDIALLVAQPFIGKSHLVMSLAIELSSSKKLTGMVKQNAPLRKTLYLSSEDGRNAVRDRVLKKNKHLSDSVQQELSQNLVFATGDIPPFVIPDESTFDEHNRHKKHISGLIEQLKEFDVLIVDTVSEAIGDCDEVKHDIIIKNTFQRIAKQANCSIILVHHVNKEEIRGNQKISIASGGGLSKVMRLTKCMFALLHEEKGKKKSLILRYLKLNYCPDEASDIELEFETDILLNKAVVSQSKPDEFPIDLESDRDVGVVKPSPNRARPTAKPDTYDDVF